jgi:hypothetical protein
MATSIDTQYRLVRQQIFLQKDEVVFQAKDMDLTIDIYYRRGRLTPYPAKAGATTPIDIYRVGDANILSRA